MRTIPRKKPPKLNLSSEFSTIKTFSPILVPHRDSDGRKRFNSPRLENPKQIYRQLCENEVRTNQQDGGSLFLFHSKRAIRNSTPSSYRNLKRKKTKTKLGPPVEIPAYPIVHQSDINFPGPLEMFFPFYPEAPQIFHTDASRVSQNQQLTTCRVFSPPKRKMNQQIFGRKRSTRDTHTPDFLGVKIRRRR
jgi:hypothetical protein